MNAQQLAKMMNQPEADVIAFVNCLRVWTDKGYSVEQAIGKHMQQMERLANNAANLPRSFVEAVAVEAFYN